MFSRIHVREIQLRNQLFKEVVATFWFWRMTLRVSDHLSERLPRQPENRPIPASGFGCLSIFGVAIHLLDLHGRKPFASIRSRLAQRLKISSHRQERTGSVTGLRHEVSHANKA